LPNLAAATKVWRKLFDSEEQLAADAHAFLTKNWRADGVANGAQEGLTISGGRPL
jgi:hypothetical protein